MTREEVRAFSYVGERESKKIGLREVPKLVGISPTYLSQIERNEFPPPAEDKIKLIARAIDQDADHLPLLAGRIPYDPIKQGIWPTLAPLGYRNVARRMAKRSSSLIPIPRRLSPVCSSGTQAEHCPCRRQLKRRGRPAWCTARAERRCR
jgi:transcriptional regulator with XRE-family HTH domain